VLNITIEIVTITILQFVDRTLDWKRSTAYAINTHVASVMLVRRDVSVSEWSDFKRDVFGVRATTRFGLGVLRSNAIAKMVNISTTL
jgi:hypothetical protein